MTYLFHSKIVNHFALKNAIRFIIFSGVIVSNVSCQSCAKYSSDLQMDAQEKVHNIPFLLKKGDRVQFELQDDDSLKDAGVIANLKQGVTSPVFMQKWVEKYKVYPNEPYFALLLTIGDNGKYIKLSSSNYITIWEDGYPKIWLNDVPHFYFNNSGHIKIKIKKLKP